MSGSFIDPGSDVWSATVTVADGLTTILLPLLLNDQSKSFDASYVFADPGSYDVTVTLHDGDAMTSATITVEVTPEGMAALPGDMDIDGDVDFDFDDIRGFVEMLRGTNRVSRSRAVGGSGDGVASNATDTALAAVDNWVSDRHAANDLGLARRPFRPDVALARADRLASEFDAAGRTGRREALLEAVSRPVSARVVSEYWRSAD